MSNKLNQISGLSGLDLFVEETLNKFDGESSEKQKLENEVEFKVFVDRVDNLEDYNDFISEIETKLNGEVIFDGKITDVRYYDSLDKNKSELNKHNIYLVRVRKQEDKENGNENIFTIKKRKNDFITSEFEEKVGDDFEDLLLNKFGLIKIKESSKYRKEIVFYVDLDGKKEKIKLAFDKYIDNKNSVINAFFEIEGNSQESIKIALFKLKELDFLKDKLDKIKITLRGPRKILEDKENKETLKVLNSFDEKCSLIQKNILHSINTLFESESIYKSYDDFVSYNRITPFVYDEKIKENFSRLLIFFLNKNVNSNKYLSYYFNRITNNNYKKFYDKFNREYVGYYRILLKSIFNEIQDLGDENVNNSNLDKIIKNKLDIFFKILFIFDDSLIRNELIDLLKLDNDIITKEFESFKENIIKIGELYFETDYNIWEKDNNRILKVLFNSYSRSYSFSVSENSDSYFNKKLIAKKLEDLKLEQFDFLERQFSHWLNSPNRSNNELEIIRKLFLENFYHIFLLYKSDVAFIDFKIEDFNKDFINEVIQKYRQNLSNKKNFLLKDKGPELLLYFLENILENNQDIVIEKIINDFKEYNKGYNNALLKTNGNVNIDRKQILDKKFHIQKIDYLVWKGLNIDSRFIIFFNKILNIDKNGIKYNFKLKYLDEFAEYEFKKFNKKDDKLYEEKFLKYKKIIVKQFNLLKNYFDKYNIGGASNLDKIIFLAENDINSFQLLVSYFQFHIKSNYDKENAENLSLYSDTFAEKVLSGLDDNIIDNKNIEFITSTSSVYNTSISDYNNIILLNDRIGNNKPINLGNNFEIKIEGKKTFLKDLKYLYLPNIQEISYENIREFLELGLETTRNLINGEEIKNKQYFNILKENNFIFSNPIYLKKLLEFLKYIYKIVLPAVKKLYDYNESNTNSNLFSIIYNFLYNKKDGYEEINNCTIAKTKSFSRIFEKSISKYFGDVEQIGDGTRATILGNDLEDLSKKIKDLIKYLTLEEKNINIKFIRFEDNIGNPFKKTKRINGYRDSKITITIDSGDTIELQFQLKHYYYIKTGEIEVLGDNLNVYDKEKKECIIENIKILDKLDNEGIIFTKQEKNKIIMYSKNTGVYIPLHFALLLDLDVNKINKLGILKERGFNADYTYNLERTIGMINKDIKYKLELLDRVLFDIPSGIIASKEIERIMKK